MSDDNEMILDVWLNEQRDQGRLVHVFLPSGIKLVGHIVAWDDEAMLLANPDSSKMVVRRDGFASIKRAK